MLDTRARIDLVVSDIMMPNLTGTALAKKMKADPRLRNVPVIFVTARAEASDMVDAISAGVRHTLRKPFKLKDLLDKVASVLDKP